MKKAYYELSAELGDGMNWSICDSTKILLQTIEAWCKEFKEEDGEEFSVEVIMLTDEELQALPEL